MQQRELPHEVLVCDDGSGEETRAVVKEFGAIGRVPVKHVWQPDDGWRVSRARNMGILRATGDYLIFIDGDCMLHPRFIEDHKKLAEPGWAVFGDRAHVRQERIEDFELNALTIVRFLIKSWLYKRSSAIRVPWHKPAVHTFNDLAARPLAELAMGCNMAFWKADAVAINGFNQNLTGWALEDIEFAARLLKSGIRAKKVKAAAIMYHLDHASTDYSPEVVLGYVESVFNHAGPFTPEGLNTLSASDGDYQR